MCCGFTACFGQLLAFSERLASLLAMVGTVCMLMTSAIFALNLGAGIGYNYCYVKLRALHAGASNGSNENLILTTTEALEPVLRTPIDIPPILRASPNSSSIEDVKNVTKLVFNKTDEYNVADGKFVRLRLRPTFTRPLSTKNMIADVPWVPINPRKMLVHPEMKLPLVLYSKDKFVTLMEKLRENNRTVILHLVY